MLDYPPTLTIKVSDKRSGQAIAHIAVIMTLFAAEKNDYHIGRVTNNDGEIPLTIDEVRQSIDCDRKLFLMDYVSSLEECLQEIEIRVLDAEQIEGVIGTMEMYKDVTDITEGLIDYFKGSVNGRYALPVIQRFEINRDATLVNVRIEPRMT